MKTKTYPQFLARTLSGSLGPGILEYALLTEGAEFDPSHSTAADVAVYELMNGGNYARVASPAAVKLDIGAIPPNVILTAGGDENTVWSDPDVLSSEEDILVSETISGSIDTPTISFGTLTGADTAIHALLVLWRVIGSEERVPVAFIGSSQGVPDFPIMVGNSSPEPTAFTIPITGLVLNTIQ